MTTEIDLATADRGDTFTPEAAGAPEAEAPAERKVDVAVESQEPATEEAPKQEEAQPEAVEEAKPVEKAEKERKTSDFIPRERFNEAITKERAKAEAAQARARELEERLATQQVSEDIAESQKVLKDLIKQRNSLLGDGEMDKASEVDEKIFDLQSAIADKKAQSKLELAKEEAKEEIRYDAVVSKIELEHPQLNPDAEEYDTELVAEVRALMRGYQAELRLSPSAALQRAANRLFGKAKAAATEEPAKTEEAGVRRKAEATTRNINVSKAQPASTREVGLDHDKRGGGLDAKTVIKLPQEEFAKLGEDVLAKLRGDSL